MIRMSMGPDRNWNYIWQFNYGRMLDQLLDHQATLQIKLPPVGRKVLLTASEIRDLLSSRLTDPWIDKIDQELRQLVL